MTETAAVSNKISATEIFAKLEAIHTDVERLRAQAIAPQDIRFYRPMKELDKGKALKVDINLRPVYNDEGYVKDIEGGVFFELVPQATLRARGKDATFAWSAQDKVVAKMGPTDIAGLLVAMEARWLRMGLPEKQGSVQYEKTERGLKVKLFHKFNEESNTAISYTLNTDGNAYLELSKQVSGITTRRDFQLTLVEEWQMKRYLERALDAYPSVGKK